MANLARVLLTAAVLLPAPAMAQDLGLKRAPDVYFIASPDALTQSVLKAQMDSRSGGVVSAVLRKTPGAAVAGARVDVEGAATPADSLKLPISAIGRGATAVGAEGVGGGHAVAPKTLNSRFLKRSIAAAQLLSIVEAMRLKANAQRVPKTAP